jgi:hypothetical protein
VTASAKVGATSSACYIIDSPNLGQGFQTAGVALRSGNNTKLYGSQTEVHAAGEIWMGFAWKFRENLRAAFGTPPRCRSRKTP